MSSKNRYNVGRPAKNQQFSKLDSDIIPQDLPVPWSHDIITEIAEETPQQHFER
jgi:hypothetical protein